MPDNEASKKLDFNLGDNSGAEVLRYAENIAAHLDEIDDIRDHIKNARAEAKGHGFDPATIMVVVKAKRAASQEGRVAKEAMDRLYLKAAGFEVAD